MFRVRAETRMELLKVDLDETLEEEDLRRVSDSGADEVLKGIGSAFSRVFE